MYLRYYVPTLFFQTMNFLKKNLCYLGCMDIIKNTSQMADRPNAEMMAAVDQALHIQGLAGSHAAIQYMEKRGVPRKVIERVTSKFGARRMSFAD